MNRLAVAAIGGALASLLAGCVNSDSYMDPSVVGRWEKTPTRVPILTHLAAIEDAAETYVEESEITPDDLKPETKVYRVGAGDTLSLTIWDLTGTGPELIPRQVDQNGYIEIPQLGRVFVSRLTETEVAEAISQRMERIVADPLVSVVVESRRQQVFYLTGAVAEPGPYFVPGADYRLYEATISAGGIPAFIKELYVIRQVPLSDDATLLSPEDPSDQFERSGNDAPEPTGEGLLDVIDDLSSPGAMRGAQGGVVPAFAQPEGEPLIDLIEPTYREVGGDNGSDAVPVQGEGRWRFRDGRWVREIMPAATRRLIEQGGDAMVPQDSRGQLFTQRVIRVPTEPLLAGDPRYNIIVRPGDIIRVPNAEIGNFYVDGEIARPGVYNLPSVGKMTLTRAITAAGGLGGLAIPERVDLTRMVGTDEQATIMLDLRAIAEGTQPDVYIRQDDRINIGTNFWATPLAILRGGFRTNYGFGFLLDRNFGNDVFGAPPTNRIN